MNIEGVIKLSESIWKGREAIAATMDELAQYIAPDRQGFVTKPSAGEEGREAIFDSTAEDAASTLAAALGSLLTNPATEWFCLGLPGDEPEGTTADWLVQTTRLMLADFVSPETHFQEETASLYMDLAVFGWGVFLTEYKDGAGLRFRTIPPSQCAIAENAEGKVDTVVRRYSQTAGQLAEEFGAENVSEKVQKALEKSPHDTFEVTHIVMPRAKLPKSIADIAPEHKAGMAASKDDALPGEEENKGKAKKPLHPFVSLYFETKAKHLLHVGGYFELPYAVPRWSKRSGEVYGRGPGHAALPSIRILNKVSESQLVVAEKQAMPALLVPDDSVIGKINTGANGITYYRPSGSDITTLPAPGDLSTMQAIREEHKNAIRSHFLNDRIQLAGGPQMTATEVVTRERKQYMVLGPASWRLQTELNGTVVERSISLKARAGVLAPPPEELRNREIQVRYVSPISRSQRQGEAESFAAAMAYITPLLQASPQALDNFNADEIVRDSQEVFGYPQSYLRDEKEVQAIRKQRAEAQQAAAAAQAAQGAANSFAP